MIPMGQRPTDPAPFISKSGNELVLKLYNAIRSLVTAQHDISALREMVDDLLRNGESVSIEIDRDRFLLNDRRIEMRSGHAVNRVLLTEFKKRKIGKIEFTGLPSDQDLEEFLRSLVSMGHDGQTKADVLQSTLEEKGIESVRVEGLRPEASGQELGIPQERCVHDTRIYFYAMQLVKEMLSRAGRGESFDLSLTRRVIRTMVFGYVEAPATFMGLATTKTNREFLANHSVNVAIYAIAMGHRLGLSNRFLVDLGLAALFHDIGESHFAWLEDAEKQELTGEEWEKVKLHSVLGVKIIMGAGGLEERTMSRLMSGIFAHHLRYDDSESQKGGKKRRIPLVGSIISLADFYDLATRPYGKNQFPCFSDRVLELIVNRAGRDFDPVLSKYFVRMLGVLPVGTLCRLDTGELGIVCSVMEDGTTGERPWVRLLVAAGETYRSGDLVCLGSVDKKTGKFQRSIREILDPNGLRIDVAEHLMAF